MASGRSLLWMILAADIAAAIALANYKPAPSGRHDNNPRIPAPAVPLGSRRVDVVQFRSDSAESTNQAAPSAATVVTVDEGVAIGKRLSPGDIPLGEKVPFDTEVFQGVFYLRLRNAPSPNEDGDSHSAYFNGSKKLYQFVTQGRFKRSGLRFSDVLLGGVFEKNLKCMPPAALLRGIRSFMETVQPGIVFNIAADKPKVLSPLGACQTMSVDLPGDEPVDFNNITENNALLGNFASTGKRRKMLSKPKTAKGYKIDPNHVYTIEGYDETLDLATFHQVLFGGRMRVDLMPVLDGQSMLLGMYTRRDLECVYKFVLTHKREDES
mmetsp:Transcript_14596/g.33526  ORF Transcript_14596/g.33526 Transcript_14596/m.33526 type:complete len:324 (-) Transcript_14596:46-1017(-)